MTKTKQILKLLVILFTSTIMAQASDVMIQGFNWVSWQNQNKWYNVVNEKSTELEAIGINAIWLPPPSKTADNAGYIPTVWYNLNTNYGTQLQLTTLINNLHANNIKVLADIVINHRGGQTGWFDFSAPNWNTPVEKWSIVQGDECNCGAGNSDYNPQWHGLKADPNTNGGFNAGRDIDHSNPLVRQGIKDWMLWLKNTIGFDGWRYDFVHGFDPIYIKEYNQHTNPYFSVGELLEGDRQRMINWLDRTKNGSTDAHSSAFDFATKSVLQNAFNDNNLSYLRDSNGKASGLIGIWPSKAVTMLDNHDTGSFPNQNHWAFPSVHLEKGHAYILTHPGNPMIFWEHLFDYGNNLKESIKKMIAIRKRNNIINNSNLNIVTAQNNLYAAIIDNKIAVKIGSGNWQPTGLDWIIAHSGNDFAIWEKQQVAPTTFTVRFKKPANWNNTVKVHFWQLMPGNTSSTWPGLNAVAEADNWYAYTFTSSSVNFLFHDGTTLNKTIDLSRNTNGWYKDGVWYNQNPDVSLPTTSFSVYFFKPTSWNSNVRIYYWNNQPASTMSAVTWPGVSLSQEGVWYKYTFNNTTSTNLIFSDGTTTNKTIDLTRSTTGYYYNGQWYHTNPIGNQQTGLTVKFFKPANWPSVKIHYWNASPTNCITNTTWPGVNMVNEGNNWFSFTFPNCTASNLIFNSGTGLQTLDLTRNSNGWYKNGVWYDGIPSARLANEKIEEVDTLLFYPNPVENNINFNMTITKVQIFNTIGQLVLEKEDTTTVSLEHLENGIYMMKTITNGSESNHKIYKK